MLDKQLFTFTWGAKKYEPIARNTLHLNTKDGGIGLVNISLKTKALQIMHIVRLLNHKHYVPKWVNFAIYWVGILLRKYRAEFASNSIPHSDVAFIPSFYHQAKLLFDDFMKSNPNIDLSQLSVKIIYEKLLETCSLKPKITINFPLHDYDRICQNVNNKFLDHELRNFAYQLAHKVLPHRVILYKYRIVNDPNCKMCNKNIPEDGMHLFWWCEEASKIWPFVKEIYLNLCNHRLKLSFNLAYWLEIPKCHSKKKQRNIVLYFVILAMFSVWKIRCISSINNTTFTIEKVKKYFLNEFKRRLQVDFYRFGHDKFIDLWGKNTILYTINKNNLNLDF
jgi:hypothetical protein